MKQILKRLIGAVPVLIGVILLVFLILHVIPGNPVLNLLEEHYNDAAIERITASMNLDQPILVQFWQYISGLLHGDLGTSYKYGRAVSEMIAEAFPYTLKLALLGAAFAWIIGLTSGIMAAIRKNRLQDRLFMGAALMGVSMPVFMTALFLQYIFAFQLKWFPLTEDGSFVSMILPAVALGWNSAGNIARMTRSSLSEVMQEDYIDTVRAKGLQERSVIIRHALKNSLLPVITMMAMQLASMLSGAVITETIFAIPGIGRMATAAIGNRDMPVLQGTVLLTTVIVIVGNLLADLLYSILDPRIRKGV